MIYPWIHPDAAVRRKTNGVVFTVSEVTERTVVIEHATFHMRETLTMTDFLARFEPATTEQRA